MTPLSDKKWLLPTHKTASETVAFAYNFPDKNPDNEWADYARRAGQFMQQPDSAGAAGEYANSLVTRQINADIESRLNAIGYARVQLNIDRYFSLKNSKIDFLFPLWEKKDNLFFVQNSIHRTDERNQANLGMGWRHFNDTSMTGGNIFWDYDWSHNNTRFGIGTEYGKDYLTLSTNGYFRISQWKDSPDVANYRERPANGWDIRAEGYLPLYPHLGGKLVYEQFYGQEVGLFGKDNRQRNPDAITAGVNYTPVPLFTVSTEHRQGKNRENDTRFGFEINYQPGVLWIQQINPDAVAQLRTLNGSRYKLVDRNNNIILEYKRNDTIRLQATDRINGYTNEKKSLQLSVTSTRPVKYIEISGPGLLAAGGHIIKEDTTHYSVVLPVYNFTNTEKNYYTVNAVAVDTEGNRSNQTQTRISVIQNTVSITQSTLTPEESHLSADGKSTQPLTLIIRDKQGQPVDIPASDIMAKVNHQLSGYRNVATVSDFIRQSAGHYTAVVTAGTQAETITVTPVAQHISLISARVFIKEATPSENNSTFTASPLIIRADNIENSILIFAAKDTNGNAISQLSSQLTFIIKDSLGNELNSGKVSLSRITENSAGIYSATFKGTLPGSYTVIPYLNTVKIGNLQEVVQIIADDRNATIADGDLQVTTDGATADGYSVNEVVAKVTDRNGNTLAGQKVIFSANNGARVTTVTGTTGSDGLAVATLTNMTAGSTQVIASLSGGTSKSVNVTFVSDISRARVSMKTTRDNAIKDGIDTDEVEATVTDNSGLPIEGINVNFKARSSFSQVITPDVTTDINGKAKTTIVSKSILANIIVATLPNGNSADTRIEFILLNPTYSLVTNNAIANGIDKNKFSITLTRPDNDLPVAGQEIVFIAQPPMILSAEKVITDETGTANITITSMHPSGGRGFTLFISAKSCCVIPLEGIMFR
ncbi:inverse autotransporter beta domain-containing protein [Morganella psychrotolerans]|uniref:inverse autotransporter beta domain-containing protein n=1 Tax=Morganella psychrotolerans TaxID=368603 RepID=UPI0039B03AEC